MKKISVFTMLAAGLLAFQSCSNNNSGKTDSTDQAEAVNEQTQPVSEKVSGFMVEAADAGMAEVQLGNLTQQNGQNQRVKSFGTMMVTDHTAANDELKTIAANKNVMLPATVSEKHQTHFEEMKKMTGADYDKHYIDMMVNDHQDVIKKFEDASQNSEDADVKAFAAKTLPKLQAHLDSAKAIQEALKK